MTISKGGCDIWLSAVSPMSEWPTAPTDRMQLFYVVVRTYLQLLVVAGPVSHSHFGAKWQLGTWAPITPGTIHSLL